MQQISKHQISRLSQAIEKLANVDTYKIDTSEISEVINLTSLKSKLPSKEICCSKSGNYLYRLDDKQLSNMLSIHGEEKTIELVKLIQRQTVSPNWIRTDYKALGGLIKYDPIGYFVYCAARIFAPLVEEYSLNYEHEEKQNILFNHQAELNNWLHFKLNKDDDDNTFLRQIHKTNELMRRLIATCHTGYIPQKTNHIYVKGLHQSRKKIFRHKNLLDITVNFDSFAYQVGKTLQSVIQHCFVNGQVSDNITFDDFIHIRKRYKGNRIMSMQEIYIEKVSQAEDNNVFLQLIKQWAPTASRLKLKAMEHNPEAIPVHNPLPEKGTMAIRKHFKGIKVSNHKIVIENGENKVSEKKTDWDLIL